MLNSSTLSIFQHFHAMPLRSPLISLRSKWRLTGFSSRFTPKNPVRLHNPFGERPRWGAKNVLPLNLITLPRGEGCDTRIPSSKKSGEAATRALNPEPNESKVKRGGEEMRIHFFTAPFYGLGLAHGGVPSLDCVRKRGWVLWVQWVRRGRCPKVVFKSPVPSHSSLIHGFGGSFDISRCFPYNTIIMEGCPSG